MAEKLKLTFSLQNWVCRLHGFNHSFLPKIASIQVCLVGLAKGRNQFLSGDLSGGEEEERPDLGANDRSSPHLHQPLQPIVDPDMVANQRNFDFGS